MARKILSTSVTLTFVALAGCAKPIPVAVAPPPPVGHIYPTLVEVPPAPKRVHIKPDYQEEVQQAFNVIGLKSALMVGALSCNQQSEYDNFMTDFQPHILDEQHIIDAYFRRIGGYAGRAQEDNFVTLLANNQSVGGIGQGAVFCLNNQAEFDRVATLKTPQDLDGFVTDQSPDPVVTPVEAVEPVAMKPVIHHRIIKHTTTAAAAAIH